MKKVLFFALLYAMPLLGFAQNEPIETFYNKYMNLEKVTNIDLEGFLLNLTASFSDEEGKEKDVSTKITKLRVLLMEEGNIVQPTDKKRLLRDLRQHDFEELVQVRDADATIDFMVRESAGKIANLLMLVDGKEGFIMLSLEGAISWEDLQKLDIDVEGGEHLKKIPRA